MFAGGTTHRLDQRRDWGSSADRYLGAGCLHESDPAELVFDVLDLTGVLEPGRDEERDDAVAEVAGNSRALCHSGTQQAGQMAEGVDPALAVCRVSCGEHPGRWVLAHRSRRR